MLHSIFVVKKTSSQVSNIDYHLRENVLTNNYLLVNITFFSVFC